MKLILGNFLSILIFLSIVAYPVMAQETTVDPTNQDVVDPSNSYQRYDEREQTPFQVNRENLPPLDDGLIWDQLGSLSDAPLEIQRGSNLQKAQYFFKKYCNYLREIGAPVNDDIPGRIKQWYSDRWTCGDHMRKLTRVFNAAGLKLTYTVNCERDSSIFDVNQNHVSIGIPDSDQNPTEIYTFDSWMLATQNGGEYDLENDPKWNGMPRSEWESEVRKQGYTGFDINNAMYYPTLDDAIRAGHVANMMISAAATGTAIGTDRSPVDIVVEPIGDIQGGKTGNEAQGSSISSDGEGWYLQGEPVITKDEEIDLPPCYTDRKVTVSNGKGHGSQKYSAECFKEGSGTYSSDVTWTVPPAYMKPGSTISFSMTFSSPEGKPTGGAIKANGGTIVEGDSRNPQGTSAATYTLPDGSPGDELELYVSFIMVSGLHGYVTYNYEYQEAGITAASATQSEVINEANAPKSVGPVDIGGTWNLYVDSELVGTGQIIQDGDRLTFINHNGQQSSGRFIDSNTVEATDWEDGLRGTLTSNGDRIDWETSVPSSWTRD